MESGIQSSFIPHDAAQAAEGQRAFSGGLLDVLALLSIVLLVASLALAAGVFLYQQFLTTSAKSKVDQLERAKAAFDPALILQLTRLDDRMRDADQLLKDHVAPSTFFHMLENVTLSTVSFRSLDFEATDPQHMIIQMDGIAESVNSIALQADLFSKNGIITSPIFSKVDRQQDGVHFNLSALVNPSAIRYIQLATAAASAPSAASMTPQSSVSSPAPSPSPSPSPAPASGPQPQSQLQPGPSQTL